MPIKSKTFGLIQQTKLYAVKLHTKNILIQISKPYLIYISLCNGQQTGKGDDVTLKKKAIYGIFT